MASRLVLEFHSGNNTTKVFAYNYADPNVAVSKLKALVNGIITNGSIFSNVPVSAKSAKVITTSETEFDLSA